MMNKRSLPAARDLAAELLAIDRPADFAQHVLGAIDRTIGCDIISYNEVDLASGAVAMDVQPADARSVVDPMAFERLATQNPLVSHYLATGDRRALRVSDVASAGAFHRLELYQELYRPLSVEYQLAVTLPAPPAIVIGIALNRSTRDFADWERHLLDFLRPVLVAAHGAALRRLQDETMLAALEAAAELRGEEVVALNDGGSIEAVTPGALGLLDAFGARRGASDRLDERLELWVARRRRRLALTGEPAQTVEMRRWERTLQIRLLHDARRALDVLVLREIPAPGAGVAAVGDEPEEPSELAAALTAREREILLAVARGWTNPRIGAELAISPRTVQRHLDHVYSKLDVHSRAAAVRRFLELSH